MTIDLFHLTLRADARIAHEKAAKKVKVIDKRTILISEDVKPDALVLCTIEVVCDSCGSVHSHPGHHLLLRHGRNYSHTGKTELLFSGVKREHIVKRSTAPRCKECWEVKADKVID